jgi:hypothetical protein
VSIASPTHKLFLSLALVLCVAGSVPAIADSAGAAGGRAASAAPLGGVNIASLDRVRSLASVDREIALASALHAKVVRVELPWSQFEPSGPNQIDPRALAVSDRLISDAAEAGIGVIAMVDSSPCWASSAPASLLRGCLPGGSSKANAWGPSNLASYAAFVAYLSQRYGTRLAAIEIWNEPDQANENYLAGPNKAQRYAAILRAAYPAIKQVNPGLPVLGGSFVGSNGAFLRALYAAGIKGYYDGLAVHFYTLTLAALRATHELQLANGDRAPLWLDEFGWSSCWPHERIQQEQGCVTGQTQAANITNTFRALARTPYVAAETIYKLQSTRSEDFGMLSVAGARKPAFAALSRVLASPHGGPGPVHLSLRRAGGRVVASGSGPVGDFMELEALQGSVLRYRALFTLDRFNHYSLALPRALGASGLHVRVYQYWAGLGAVAQRSI